LLRGAQPGGTAADHGDALAGAVRRRLRLHPALVPGAVDDRDLDLLDGDRVVVDRQNAGRLAGRGADAAGELGEVVGVVEAGDGALPVVLVDEVVPFGDEVAQGAAVVAEGNAAVHAAGALLADGLRGE